MKLVPDVIRMDAFYSGAQMRIEGLAAEGAGVIVVVRGPETEEVFNKRGRAGPIWINVGKVRISGVPSLFLCYSTQPVERLLGQELIEKHGLGRPALKRRMKVEPKELDQEIIRDNYLELKTGQRVHRVESAAVKLGPPGAAGVPYAVEFHWPRRAPPARYEVSVYQCRAGALVGEATAPLEVVKAGFPKALAYLATQHDSIYGIVAVFAAALAGFGIDFLASRLRKVGVREVREAAAAPGEAPKAEPARRVH